MKKRHKWYWMFLVVALLDLCTVGASIFLSHQTLANFRDSVQQNQVWSDRLRGYAELRARMVEANSPAKEIFEGHDPDQQERVMHLALNRFRAQLAVCELDLRGRPDSTALSIHQRLQALELSMQHMAADADEIFRQFRSGKERVAGHRLAAMDRRFTQALKDLELIRIEVNKAQAGQLAAQHELMRRNQHLEYFIGCMILLMIVGAIWYARVMAVRSDSDWNQMLILQEQLQRSRIHLELKVAERTSELEVEVNTHKATKVLLEQENARFKLLSMATDDVLWDWNLYSRTIWRSNNFSQSFGHQEDAVPVHVSDSGLIHPEDSARVRESIAHALLTDQEHWSAEYRMLHADGSWAHVLDRGYIMRDEQNHPVRMVGAMMDCSQQKTAESELRAAKIAAEQASLAKGQFLANMSHEIRTPLNGVVGVIELLADTELRPEQVEYLRTIQNSAQLLLRVINDILDFSKIEAGKLHFEQVEFELHTVVEDAAKSLAIEAHSKGLELNVDIDPRCPEILIGDSSRLRQVLTNLVVNAKKFTDQGEINISVKPMNVSNGQAQMHFSVRDTGIGIPEEKLQKVFEAFEQVDGTSRRKHGGTGLGLTIASALVEIMGGRIWVESEVGAGTTFHFTMVTPIGTSKPRADLATLQGHPVLIVDDNPTNLRIVEHLAAAFGMSPVTASSGAEAIEKLEDIRRRAEKDPIILTDSRMPGMDGFELISRIRRSQLCGASAVLMLTSDDQREDLVRCRELGIAQYLVKPIRRADLLIAIQKLLSSAASNEQQPAVPTQSQGSERSSLTVLVADDNVVNQMVTRRMIERLGYQVTVVDNGKAAVEACERHSYDLVLMDLQMPDMDGLEATSIIRMRDRIAHRHSKIVALTAHAMVEDRDRCLAAGMDGYLSKPVRMEDFKQVMTQIDSRPCSLG